MKISSTIFKLVIFIIGFFMLQSGFLLITPGVKAAFNHKTYNIRSTSILEVNGKTNVNSFSCSSSKRETKGKLSYQIESGTAIINFQNTQLPIKIQQLDCGAKAINKDLFKALQADEYPNIIIDLVQLFNLQCDDLSDCESWVDFEALADITIVCTSKSVYIPVKVRKLDDYSYRILGTKCLELCDFGVEPPTAMLGLIKVENEIEINFDLFVDLD